MNDTGCVLRVKVPPYVWRRYQELDADRQAALTNRVRTLPRPPKSFDELLSPEFVERANCTELSKLVMQEPGVVASLLSTVNSPVWALRQPVTSIGQAITFLGMNQVRALCMQFFLARGFRSADTRVSQALNQVWDTNVLAVKILSGFRTMGLVSDVPKFTSVVILSFVGQMAAVSLMPVLSLKAWMQLPRQMRFRAEQEFIGLNSAELGQVIFAQWGVPAAIADDVSAMEYHTFESMSLAVKDQRDSGTAYLSVWLAEKLARGLVDPVAPDWEPLDANEPELRAWLSGKHEEDIHCYTQALRKPWMTDLCQQRPVAR